VLNPYATGRRHGSYDLRVSCANCPPLTTTLQANGPVTIGANAELLLTGSGSVYYLFLDGAPLYSGMNFGFRTLWDLPIPTMFLVAQGAMDPGGSTIITIPVPDDPALIGVSAWLQTLTVAGPPMGTLSISNLLRVVIGDGP
jgi:hypothetical protein